MATDIIRCAHDREMFILRLREQGFPYTITVGKGKIRSILQNRLQRKWMNEIAEQLGDRTAEEVRGYCKLTIGVPILRAENESFCLQYDTIIKPLPYEQKLSIMQEPLDFPITRLMDTAQKTQYLDGVHRHFAEKGVILTLPQRGPDDYEQR